MIDYEYNMYVNFLEYLKQNDLSAYAFFNDNFVFESFDAYNETIKLKIKSESHKLIIMLQAELLFSIDEIDKMYQRLTDIRYYCFFYKRDYIKVYLYYQLMQMLNEKS